MNCDFSLIFVDFCHAFCSHLVTVSSKKQSQFLDASTDA